MMSNAICIECGDTIDANNLCVSCEDNGTLGIYVEESCMPEHLEFIHGMDEDMVEKELYKISQKRGNND